MKSYIPGIFAKPVSLAAEKKLIPSSFSSSSSSYFLSSSPESAFVSL
jgi:hypothetical protein